MTRLAAGAVAILSWARQGLAGQLLSDGAVSQGGRLQLQLPLWLMRTQAPTAQPPLTVATPPAVFLGPVDVVGLDPLQVIRTEPVAHTAGFEPNYFASIEFDRPDLPWMFSPGCPVEDRWQPWITLIVVPVAIAQVVPAADPTAALPTITCPLAELPPLAESWAWAHTQVMAGASEAELDELLADSLRSLSRLVAARRLTSRCAYVACVVPTYELGRRSGLGAAVTTADLADPLLALAPAWGDASAAPAVELPVYYSWEFSTGDAGDFELLARRLAPGASLADANGLAVDVSEPGWGVPHAGQDPAAHLYVRGALVDPDAVPPPWVPNPAFESAMTAVLNEPQRQAVPVIAPPLYGQAYPKLSTLPPGAAANGWFCALNLQVENRIAAGLGAMVVRFEQESMMAAAWDQLAAHERENRKSQQQQLSQAVAQGLASRTLLRGPVLASVPAPALASTQVPARQAEMTRARLIRAGLAAHRVTPDWATPSQLRATRGAAAALVAPGLLAPSPVNAAPAAPAAAPTEMQTFTPQFATATAELLADYFPAFLFPGMDRIGPESVTLLQANPAFIEAFLVGLNHEMNRELHWRRYPFDPRGTSLRAFWDRGSATGTDAGSDIRAIDAWPSASPLGDSSHRPSQAPGSAAPLVLVVRGELLARYPRAVVQAVQAEWNADGHRTLSNVHKQPLFQMLRAPDVVMFAFDLTKAQMRGADDASGDAGWYFVVQQPPGEPRFGLDVETTQYGGDPAAWRDLSWSDVAADEAALTALTWLPLLARANTPKPVDAASPAAGAATWGSSAADMATITRQMPFRLAIHGRRWLGVSAATPPLQGTPT